MSGLRKEQIMAQQSEARKRFLEVALVHGLRASENFEALMAMAQEIVRAETVGFKIDPDSVERAVKNLLGVN